MTSGRLPIQAEWNKIKAAYEAGETLKNISQKYGVKLGTISSRAKREGWEKKAGKQGGGRGRTSTKNKAHAVASPNEAWMEEVEKLRDLTKKGREKLGQMLERLEKEIQNGKEEVFGGEHQITLDVSAQYIADVLVKFANAANKLTGTSKLLYQNVELVGANDLTKEQEESALSAVKDRLATVRKLKAVK